MIDIKKSFIDDLDNYHAFKMVSGFANYHACHNITCVCMGSSYCCIVAHVYLRNSTGRRTVTLVAALVLINGPVRYEGVVHSCGRSLVGGRVWTHGGFIVLPHWNTRLLTP